MGLKKKAKVSAQFNMSSLTDIIFLLLIFFMLTSTIVAPNAINFKLPGSSKPRVKASSQLDRIRVSKNGYYYNNRRITLPEIEDQLSALAAGKEPDSESVILRIDKDAPVERVVAVMDLTLRYDINRILAPEK
ncbi:MAG: biopolymer transporter ExbD [Bacteroidetes bacterium]|nr:MAG: biopolymer transporter ExbD [Bacteroidota bacterium]